jgi:hypothetical protein
MLYLNPLNLDSIFVVIKALLVNLIFSLRTNLPIKLHKN